MPRILHIETATEVCSVALSHSNAKFAGAEEDTTGFAHAEKLTVLIDALMKKTNTEFNQLDAVAVSYGPGSYTGLRIGMSAAKGFCYALNIPLITISTLKAMAAGAVHLRDVENLLLQPDVVLCPMIDARRMEVYAAFYDKDLNEIRPPSADIIDANSYNDYLKKNKMLFLGNGAAKCKPVLSPKANTYFFDEFQLSAQNMIGLAHAAFKEKQFANLAYSEPFYLKEFQTGVKA
ncbi:MAG: tRNA threonylcarbamoyladenosine biosynthesis protein TsaB [Bacteroidia bacterium]|nr:tRNA threonylcarbamoyladenosine biosynthesis protein TsaB [Bacteroidia bacterium]